MHKEKISSAKECEEWFIKKQRGLAVPHLGSCRQPTESARHHRAPGHWVLPPQVSLAHERIPKNRLLGLFPLLQTSSLFSASATFVKLTIPTRNVGSVYLSALWGLKTRPAKASKNSSRQMVTYWDSQKLPQEEMSAWERSGRQDSGLQTQCHDMAHLHGKGSWQQVLGKHSVMPNRI